MNARLALPSTLAIVLLAGACEQHNLPVCDITQRACQVDIYYRMLSLRGDGYDPFGGLPPVSVISEDQYRDRLIQQQAQQTAQSGPSPWDKGLDLLHFNANPSAGDAGTGGDAGGSTIDDEVAHTLAFYESEKKTITIISHPDQTSATAEEEAMITLAHELVHAIQDRELDLRKDDFHTSDEYFAYDTIIEGDARFYEYMFAKEIPGFFNAPLDQVLALPQQELDNIYTAFAGKSTPMFLAQLLVYPLGANYQAQEYRSGGNAAVRHGYSKEPHHMVGFLGTPDGSFPTVAADQGCLGLYVPSLPLQGKTVGADEFGALMFYAFLRGWGVDHTTAYAAAQAWTGDFILVQATADFSTTAVSWRLQFSTTPPSSLVQALSASGQLTVTAGSRSLQITATDASAALTWKPDATCP
jgi:hypothetical protein